MKLRYYLYTLFLLSCFSIYYQISASGYNKSSQQKKLLNSWFHSIETGDINSIKKLVGKVNINAKNSAGWYALIVASDRCRENVIQLLLQMPTIDINAQDSFGYTTLMNAACFGQENIVKLILQVASINVNLQNSGGETALIIATTRGYTHIVKALLEVPTININIQDVLGYTALTWAKIRDHEEIAQLLESKIKELRNQILELLSRSIKSESDAEQKDYISQIKSIVAQIGSDWIIDDKGNSLLHKAFANKMQELALFLLQNAKDPQELLTRQNYLGETALELISPTSALFCLCMDLAYVPKTDISSRIHNFINTLKKKLNMGGNCSSVSAPSSLAEFPSAPSVSSDSVKAKSDTLGEHYKVRACAYCQKANCTSRCGKCRNIYYCSEKCQRIHWIKHKSHCLAALP